MASKVLIVRFSSIGDIVLTSPIVRCVSEQLDVEVHYLTKEKFAPIIKHNPYISKLYGIKKNVSEVINQLKAENYDYIIDLHKNLRTQEVKLKLGIQSYTFDKLNIQKWLKVNLKLDLLPHKHIVDRYFEGIRSLQVTNDGLGLDYFISNEDQSAADSYTQPYRRYDVLVLGANYYTKRIPQVLSEKIIDQNANTIILLGGDDVGQEGTILANKYPTKTVNLVGKTSLAVSSGIIKNAHEIHTGDTGLMHIAAAYKRNIHTYWGSTIPEFGMYAYLPSNNGNKIDHQVVDLHCRPCSKLGYDHCPKKHFKCMLDIKI